MSNELFEGATINGKQFPFVRITVAGGARINKKLNPTLCGTIIQLITFQWLRPASVNIRWWKKLRSIAFVKTGLWKYLRVVPKELRCSNILLREVSEIEKSFFDYAGVKASARGVLFISAKDSQTENNNQKSAD